MMFFWLPPLFENVFFNRNVNKPRRLQLHRTATYHCPKGHLWHREVGTAAFAPALQVVLQDRHQAAGWVERRAPDLNQEGQEVKSTIQTGDLLEAGEDEDQTLHLLGF